MKKLSFCVCCFLLLLALAGCSKVINSDKKYCESIKTLKHTINIYEDLGNIQSLSDTVLEGSSVVFDATAYLPDSVPFTTYKSIEWKIGNSTFHGMTKVRMTFPPGSAREILVALKLTIDLNMPDCLFDTSTIELSKQLHIRPIVNSRLAGTYTGNNIGETDAPFTVSITDEYRNGFFYGYWIKNINKGCFQEMIPSGQLVLTPGVKMNIGYKAASFLLAGMSYGCNNVSGRLYLEGNKIVIDHRYADEKEYGVVSNPRYYNKKFVGYKN